MAMLKKGGGCEHDKYGGCSYGPWQLASNGERGISDFFKYLKTRATETEEMAASEKAVAYLAALNKVGGIEAARRGDKAFVDKWMELTAEHGQFVQYQFDSIAYGPNMEVVRKHLTKVGIDFEKLTREQKEAIFSTAVQHGGGGAYGISQRKDKNGKIKPAKEGALQYAFSEKTTGPYESRYFEKEVQLDDALAKQRVLNAQRESAIKQHDQLQTQKIALLEARASSAAAGLKNVDKQIKSIDIQIQDLNRRVAQQEQKVEAANDVVEQKDKFVEQRVKEAEQNQKTVDELEKWMRTKAEKALEKSEQFLKDIYDWRIKAKPDEKDSRYIIERDLLLEDLKQRRIREEHTQAPPQPQLPKTQPPTRESQTTAQQK